MREEIALRVKAFRHALEKAAREQPEECRNGSRWCELRRFPHGNGTGKSSFCEALETAMLGSISEARVKRVDHRIYCNNARLRRHEIPILTHRSGDTPPGAITANEEAFRFCFIEKNRLDDVA